MNIKVNLNNKILKTLLCSTPFAAAGIMAAEEIRELNDTEFEQKKAEINRKKAKLNKINRNILENIPVNKYNIQCLNILMDSNKDFYRLYDTLYNINNINSAKFLSYELQKEKEISETLGECFIKSDVHRSINTPEELDFKVKFIEYGLANPDAGSNIYFADIAKEANNMDEALAMLKHTQKYGLMPSDRKNFQQRFGEKTAEKMLDEAAEAKTRFNLNLDYIAPYANTYKEPFHIIKSRDTLFRFDPKTAEIITLEKENQIYNLKNNTVTTLTPQLIKEDEKAFLDDKKLLKAKVETKTLDGRHINLHQFKKSKIKGEFEVEEISQNGKTYKTGLAELDRKGGKHIEKHFTSQDGTVTDYVFADDKKGNRYLYYKITDKDNNVLYKSEKNFKVLSDNHFQSSTNGILYDIVFTKDKVKVTKNNETIEFAIKEYTKQDYKNIEELVKECMRDSEIKDKLDTRQTTFGEIAVQKGIIDKFTIDKKLIKTLKNLSGEEWFALKNSNIYSINNSQEKDTAHSLGNQIEVSSDNNLFSTIEHEIGHEKYNTLKLDKDEALKQIYEYEKNQFTTTMPDLAVAQAGYFLRNLMSNGLAETAAESNLITNIPQAWEKTGSRTLFLQKNFPKTIAYIANKYQELM